MSVLKRDLFRTEKFVFIYIYIYTHALQEILIHIKYFHAAVSCRTNCFRWWCCCRICFLLLTYVDVQLFLLQILQLLMFLFPVSVMYCSYIYQVLRYTDIDVITLVIAADDGGNRNGPEESVTIVHVSASWPCFAVNLGCVAVSGDVFRLLLVMFLACKVRWLLERPLSLTSRFLYE